MTDQNKYEEWLSCIANTRLVFNSISELEHFLEAPSIHSNGIKRCFTSFQRLRSAFRDLAYEIDEQTDGNLDLKTILIQYQKSWTFFRENLSRRSHPFEVALELLRYHYPPYLRNNIGRKKQAIYRAVEKQHISVPFLILFLLKGFPGYDSKNGDVTDINVLFEKVLSLLEKLTEGCDIYTKLPSIIAAREEPKKTRLSLLYHISSILNTYEAYSSQNNLYDASAEIKSRKVYLDLTGYWNECDGKLQNTTFWELEPAINDGAYFATFWQKDAGNNLTGTRFTLFHFEHDVGSLVAYMVHPEAIKNRMKGNPYTDKDHVWYNTDLPANKTPLKLPFRRLMASSVWKANLNLTRITDQKTIGIYENWFKTCNIKRPYSHLEYTFFPEIHAITQDDIYLSTEDGQAFYKIPKSSFEGFENIQIGDNIGLMRMDGKTYFAFDEFLIYLPATNHTMKKYGITIVDSIK